MREVVYEFDVAREADRLPGDMPVQLLHGDRDATAPLAGVDEMVRRHPRWQLNVLAGGDHQLMLRDPDWCLSRIRALVDATTASAHPRVRRVGAS